MMYVILRYDQYGRATITRSVETKAEIGTLEANEVVNTTYDLEAFKIEIQNRNTFRKNQILGIVNEINVVPNYTAEISISSNVINPAKISPDGMAAIKAFQENPSDLNLGKVMDFHNKEKWSDHVFCCGSQKQQLENLLKTMDV